MNQEAYGMSEQEKVPCGLYRTTEAIDETVPAGSLVYYHNHGDPGPGVYPAERWHQNKAQFSKRGVLVPDEYFAASMHPLPHEGFYRVLEPFTCCHKNCREFETDTLIQLGYNGRGQAIAFVPEWSEAGLHLPEKGTAIDEDRFSKLKPLKMARPAPEESEGEDSTLH